MERLTGWFWKGSSKADDKQETVTSTKTEKIQETVDDSAQVNSTLNKSSNAQTNVMDSIKPVLYDKSDPLVNARLWIQQYTYLQPEDCLTCKLTITCAATLLLASGVNAYGTYIKNKKLYAVYRSDIRRLQTATRGTYACMFAMWGVLVYAEWYYALFYPPGEQPRSFIQREAMRMKFLKEAVHKYKAGGKTDIEKDPER